MIWGYSNLANSMVNQLLYHYISLTNIIVRCFELGYFSMVVFTDVPLSPLTIEIKAAMKKTTFSFKKTIVFAIFGGLFFLWACQNQPATNEAIAEASGEDLYVSYCQICHGNGDEAGPMAEVLTTIPLDLRLIAVRRNGEFPRDEIIKIIDGRSAVKGHRHTEMPIWGKTFQESEGLESNRKVKAKIESIVDYLESIQKDLESIQKDLEG